RDCVDVPYLSGRGRLLTIGAADRQLPVANTVAPGSAPCPTSDLFGLGAAVGVTSRSIGASKAARYCLNAAPGFARPPIDFPVAFPSGVFSIYGVHRADASGTGTAFAIGNTIVVESVP